MAPKTETTRTLCEKSSGSPESGPPGQGQTHHDLKLPMKPAQRRCRSHSKRFARDSSGNSKSSELRKALLSPPNQKSGERHDSRRRTCSGVGIRTRSTTKARGDTRKEGCSRLTSATVRSNSLHRMEKWKSRLRRGEVVLEDPRFKRQRTEPESKPPSPSCHASHSEISAIQVTPKNVNRRSNSVESISKRIKAELVEQTELETPKSVTARRLTTPNIKKERTRDAGTSSESRQKWVLQKFIDGVKSGDPINLSELGFPVPIGRDPMKVKIHLDGPKKKHVSRYHAELHDDAGGLRVQCFSDNGILVNHNDFLARNESFILKNSDIFSIGDATDEQKDSVQNIMFVVHYETVVAGTPHIKPELHEQVIEVVSDSEETDKKTPIGSSNACPILIIDDDDDAQLYEGNGSVRVENNQGLSDMLMKFKDEPLEDEEGAAESPSTASSTGSPVIPATAEMAPFRTTIEKSPRIEPNVKNKNPALTPIVSPRVPLDSPTETRALLFNSPPPPRIRETPDFAPTFNAYRHCILNLDVNKPDGDPSQMSEKVFIDFVQERGSSKALRDVTRVLFSVFCLEAASRVKTGWRKAQQSHTRKAAIVAQAALTKDVYRVTMMLVSEGRGYFTDCTALRISANFVRLDGQGSKRRVLLGMVHKVDTIDRRRRNGGIQVPSILAGDSRGPDQVDILEVDVDKSAFKGAKLNSEVLIDVSRVCEVRELKKILCLHQIPDSYCKVLRGMKGFIVVGPNDLTSPQMYPEQVARVTHCSMLTSEQTSVVCATLSLLATPVTAVSVMLVEGEAGTGKSVALLETAFECVVAKPSETVLIFCKWSGVADLVAHYLLDIKERKKLKLPNGEPIKICRVAGSQHQRIQKVCLTTLLEEERNSTLKQEIERKDKSIQEQKKRIADLKISLEDQLEKLPNFVKTRKLAEIAQQEAALTNDVKERGILVERLKQPTGRHNASPGATAVLEGSNILVCSSADIETNIIGQAFRSSGAAKISVVLIDQAQQCLLSDLVPIMQLNCQRLVMFGDSNQSAFLKHVVKHKVLKEKNPYVPSEFVKCCRKHYNKRFRLTRSFRVRPPLRDIVSNIFIRNPASPSMQTFNGSLSEHELSPLTIFDIDEEPREELIIERIVQACAQVLKKVHLIVPSPGATQKFQVLSKKCNKEHGIVAKTGIPEVLDAETISVLIIPTFDANLLREINVDRAALYSMLTRASKATIVVGNFTNIKEQCSVLDELAEQSKAVGRFFHHSARTFMHINLSEILMHLRP